MTMTNQSIELKGQKASPGLGYGPVFVLNQFDVKKDFAKNSSKKFDSNNEVSLFEKALTQALADLETLKTKFIGQDSSKVEILEAHQSLIDDPEVKDQTLEKIKSENKFAFIAYDEVIAVFKEMFAGLEDPYLRQRVLDLDDISKRVLFYIANPGSKFSEIILDKPSIVVAHDMTPSEILTLDKHKVLGMVLLQGSPQSHTSILARSMEIPCIVGVHDLEKLDTSKFKDLILDADSSKVVLNPNDKDIATFQGKMTALNSHKMFLSTFKNKPTKTKSGKIIPLGANISGPQDIESVLNNDAELVGLYRTEFLFLDRATAPSENEQYETYKEVFKKLGHKRIILRTLDIGGDKEAPYINVGKEDNPFLGVRGIRLCLYDKTLFKTQLRAVLKASKHCSDLGIMFPMVSTISEITEAKAIFNEAKQELLAEKIEIGKKIDIGVMMEVPSLAWILKEVADEVSFISIGTNDLFQYSNACDRMNTKLKSISSPTHEGFLRFLKFILTEARNYKLHVGVCGSIAHHPEIMPYLISCGVDDLSMTAQHILESRAKISEL